MSSTPILHFCMKKTPLQTEKYIPDLLRIQIQKVPKLIKEHRNSYQAFYPSIICFAFEKVKWMIWLPTDHPEQVSDRKYTHSENICTVCWRKQNGDNTKHLTVASPSTVSTTLETVKQSLPRIHFSPPQTSKVLLCSLYFYIPRRRSPPAVRRHKTGKKKREYLMLSKLSG